MKAINGTMTGRPPRARRSHRRLASMLTLVLALSSGLVGIMAAPALAAPCDAPVANPVLCENSLPGNPKSEWDNISGAGNQSIQGFATEISVNRGETVRFKVDTDAAAWRIDVYRLGYYGGMGARKQATVTPSRPGNQNQPNCTTQASTGLVDCGNWTESASWAVPVTAVSGVYIARLVRTDNNGASHMVFVVRDDASTSALLFQTSDTTWQAYNDYGGNSLYTGSPDGRAYKVSYNRPFATRGVDGGQDWLFNSEYPMIRFLEANGYNVSYASGLDTDRRGAAGITAHKTFLSVGHDEYWSGGQRSNVEAARAAGVNLAFFSGNEVFWKTRWEPSIAGPAAANRTLVCYKETHADAKIDPTAAWTGTWRDPRFSPPADGGRPENAFTGQIFKVNEGTTNIAVPSADGKMRFWRNTSVATLAANATAALPAGTLGYEWDVDADNGFRPAGLVRLSTKTFNAPSVLQDYGSSYGSGTATHNMTIYRDPASRALVFGAGTIQWPWGLDAVHDRGNGAADVRMRQATVNILADMGAQAGSLQSGLVAATATADTTGPAVVIASPAAGATVTAGTPTTVSGTATDSGGGVVGGVEVSTDNGATWHPATGRASWTYAWTPNTSGPITIKARATDDSANLGAEVSRALNGGGGGGPQTCPCTIWPSTAVPSVVSDSDTGSVELGVKFRAASNGTVTGVRFYKGATNTGTHTGHLWSSTGTLLGSVTFSGETASGWQQATFPTPVAITADTTYVISYLAPVGRYSVNTGYFTGQGVSNPPLTALASGVDGLNGLYRYGASAFPNNSFGDSNYWVDVVFTTGGTGGGDTTPPTVTGRTPAPGATGVATNTTVTATFSEAVQPATITFGLTGAGGATVPGSTTYDAASRTATFQPTAALAASTLHTATVNGAKDTAGNTMTAASTWSFTTTAAAGSCPCSVWSSAAVPGTVDDGDTAAVELGLKFRSSVAGSVTGVRFYKGTANTGTHTGHLWSSTGTLLASATFTGESASGWQQANFPTPVAIAANTTYVISYFAPAGHYAGDENFFAAAGVSNPPLTALAAGVDGANGVYRYGTAAGFPSSTYRSTNYWVDVVFAGG